MVCHAQGPFELSSSTRNKLETNNFSDPRHLQIVDIQSYVSRVSSRF